MPYAQAPGARLYYEEAGSGTPIVFVHETMSDLRSWEAQVHAFARQYRCIAFNARGYPKSDLGGQPATHDHLRLADDIGAVMDAAGVDRAFVVGSSMGAYVTAHFAMRQPRRLLGMVLGGLGAGSDDPQHFRSGTLAAARELRQNGYPRLLEAFANGPNRMQLHIKDRRGWDNWVAEMQEIDAVGMANILEHCHARRPPIYESEAGLSKLTVPTLIVVGDEDEPCLLPGLFLKRAMPAAGLWICPRTGHLSHVEEPALFNAALQSFITAVGNGAWGVRDPRTRGAQQLAPEEAKK